MYNNYKTFQKLFVSEMKNSFLHLKLNETSLIVSTREANQLD